MENLRRQLHADVEFEEKIAKQKTNEALIKRLKEVEGKLEALGCVGPGIKNISFIFISIKFQTSQSQHRKSTCKIQLCAELSSTTSSQRACCQSRIDL
jgi:hypothetical protein